MLKIILFGFVVVLGVLAYKFIKESINEKSDNLRKSKTSMSFAELKEELEFKVAFYKKKVEEGQKEAAEKLEYYQQELEEINVYQKFRK